MCELVGYVVDKIGNSVEISKLYFEVEDYVTW